LEVGTGFHPELTGRENIHLNGAILGMTRKEMSRQFDAIVAFADIEQFLDTPVKRYSSGMYVRLAFAVAAHLEPEILLIDEVLAVGDASFQKKCLGKIRDVAHSGRTVVFVSHNMTAIRSLCHRALWLDQGQLLRDGDSAEIVGAYTRTTASESRNRIWTNRDTAPGNERVKLLRATLRPNEGSPDDLITVRTPFVMEFEYWNLEAGAALNLSVHVVNQEGTTVFNTGPIREKVWNGRPFPRGLYRSTCCVPGDLLNDGVYFVHLMLIRDQCALVYRHDNLLTLEVIDSPEHRGTWFGKWPGAVRPDLLWTTERLDETRIEADSRTTQRALQLW
jgi:lipopolysaccharide transport system ATP-binding protein